MRANAPAVIHVVAFRGQGRDHPDILRVPVALRVVRRLRALATQAAIVIHAILQENPNRLPGSLANQVGINVSAANVRKTADRAQDFAELVGAVPRDREGGNGA